MCPKVGDRPASVPGVREDGCWGGFSTGIAIGRTQDIESQELSDTRKTEAQTPELLDPGIGRSTKTTVDPPIISEDSNPRAGGQHMICTNCQHASPGDSNFCMNCGKRLGYYCGHCKAILPVGAKFCNHCGHELSVQSGDDVIATLKRGECVNLQAMIDNFETLLIDTAMHVAEGNFSRAAELLQMHRTTLYSRVQSKSQK